MPNRAMPRFKDAEIEITMKALEHYELIVQNEIDSFEASLDEIQCFMDDSPQKLEAIDLLQNLIWNKKNELRELIPGVISKINE